MHFRIFSAWRLIAAVVVMVYHFSHYGPEGSKNVVARLELLMPMLDMFFIISGFLIFSAYADKVRDMPDYLSYLGRRFARIYPLHLITTGFFAAIGVAGALGLVNTGGVARYDIGQLLHNLLLLQAWGVTRELSLNYVSWSLSAEWLCYLLLPVIAFAFRRAGIAGLIALFAAIVLTLEFLAATGVMPFKTWLHADTWGAWRAFADFVVGAFIAVVAARSPGWLRSHWPAWLVMFSSIAAMQLGWPPYAGYFLMAVSLYLAAVCERNAPENAQWLDAFAPVAAVSFGIYMWHPVVETVTYNVLWPKIFAPTGLNFYVFMAVPMFLSVVVAMVSANTFERWAGRRLSGMLSPRRRAAPAE